MTVGRTLRSRAVVPTAASVMTVTASLAGAFTAFLPVLLAVPLSAQTASGTARPSAPMTPGPAPWAFSAEARTAHATVTAVAIHLRAGSADDPAGAEGTAWLLARVLGSEATRALSSLPAALTARVERRGTLYTLVADPAVADLARARVDSVLFRGPLDPDVLEACRTALLDELRFEAGSPVADFDREAAALLGEPGSAFVRPRRGTSETIQALDAAALEAYRRDLYRRDRAAVAVVGPAAGVPRAETAATDTSAVDTAAADAPAPVPPPDIAWRTGARRTVTRDVTSTWITVAYPAPTDLPFTRLEFLAHELDDALDPSPPDPDRYGVSVRIEDTPHGAVLLVEATVLPEAADRWEEKILAAVRRTAAQPQEADYMTWRRRRFRARRLEEDGAPESRAARMTADLLRDGSVRDLQAEIWELNADALRDAAQALGEPRIFRYGPDLSNGSGGPGGA